MRCFGKIKHVVVSALGVAFVGTTASALAEPVHVQARPLSELVEYRGHVAPATVLSINDSRISAEISARVVAVPVRVGDHVVAGEDLVRLDDSDLRRAVETEQAKLDGLAARLAFARFQLSRAKTLSGQQLMSDELLRQRQADVDSLIADRRAQEAVLALSRQRLAKTRIRAPYDGIVTERTAQLGQLTAQGEPLVSLFDPQHLEVSADIQPTEADSLIRARDPRLHVDGREYPLEIRTVLPKVELPGRTRQARLRFSGAAALAGRAGELKWTDDHGMVPAELILQRGDRYGFFIVNGGHAKLVPLPDAQPGRPADIPSGEAPDSMVVTEGRYGLHDGDEVVLK